MKSTTIQLLLPFLLPTVALWLKNSMKSTITGIAISWSVLVPYEEHEYRIITAISTSHCGLVAEEQHEKYN